MGEQALRRSLLHLAGSQNPVEVVDLVALICPLGPVENHAALHRREDDKVLPIELFPEIRKDIVLGKTHELVAIVPVELGRLLRSQHPVRNRGVAVDISLVPVSILLKAVIFSHFLILPYGAS